MKNNQNFYYGKHYIDSKDINNVTKSLKSFLSQGPQLINFEKKVAKYFGSKYCVAVSSATAALHISITAMNLKKNSKSYTSNMTFVATTNACLYNNLKIDLIDINLDNFNINLDQLEAKLEKLSPKEKKKKKLIIPVHFGGLSVDMKRIHDLKKKYNCYVLEDASQSMGATFHKKYVGSCKFSDIAVFSLHPVKSITTGEGGLILTNNKKFYEKLLLLRSHGLEKSKKNHWQNNMLFLGYNYKITDFQCALGISQLSKLKGFISKRNKIAVFYKEKLKSLNINFQNFDKSRYTNAYHYFIISFVKEVSNKKNILFLNLLKKKGIYLGKQYLPIHMHNFYKKKISNKFVNSEKYFKQSYQLPIYPSLSKRNLEYICDNIISASKKLNM
tara:strand:+ start:1786 stop:2946 length:1161 start_codon:yes stop_codon:yes gene_type:complete